ncbi:hypothetical protein K7H20_13945 [Salipiger manganoxidans]|uniref:hypothetical protein n=1 Tax=Salipiger marinus TaxID=555512 RepID=UPI001E621801|nr:hypothetical protein [Salipiger manganoxidans]MCD1619168.1 hypothetical protein [Salipiger manganoxidans]
MIRQPTTEAASLAWWRSAVADRRTPRHDGEPQCGYYALRKVRGGPFVPVRIYLEQEIDPETGELTAPELMRADEGGRQFDPTRIWTFLRPISTAEYFALLEGHRTSPVMQATHVSVDLSLTPILP